MWATVYGEPADSPAEAGLARISALPFDGYAIVAPSADEPDGVGWTLNSTLEALPFDRPRCLLGPGTPIRVLDAIQAGVDLVGGQGPIRQARQGILYTPDGPLDVLNDAAAEAFMPVDGACDCYTCARFSLAYLHHLFAARELLAHRLATIHNLAFILKLTAQARDAIADGNLSELRHRFDSRYRRRPNEH